MLKQVRSNPILDQTRVINEPPLGVLIHDPRGEPSPTPSPHDECSGNWKSHHQPGNPVITWFIRVSAGQASSKKAISTDDDKLLFEVLACSHNQRMLAMRSANAALFTNHAQVKHSPVCSTLHSPLLRDRPALNLRTLVNHGSTRRTGVYAHAFQVSCQQGRQLHCKSLSAHTPEVCPEEDVVKTVPAWRKLASFLVKTTAVAALALALVSPAELYATSANLDHTSSPLYLQTFGSVSSAEAARSGGRMGGSGFSSARSGAGSYSR